MLRWSVFILLTFVATASGATLNVMIVDAGHTVTADRIADAIGGLPDVKVAKFDYTTLRGFEKPKDGVVIWIDPAPGLFGQTAGALWEWVRDRREVGLMIVGLEESNDCFWMMDVLRRRVDAEPGPLLSTHLDGGNWIWAKGAQDRQSDVVLEKTFELTELPARAWMQL